MTKEQILYSAVLLFGVLVSALSQVLLKKSAQKKYASRLREYLNPYVIIAYIIFFSATIFTVIAYKVVPLSMGPILQATSYIYVTIFGVVFFKEKINKQGILGLALIILGIVMFSLT